MQDRFIRNYYQFINKMLPILEDKINQTKIPEVRKILLDMDLEFIMFKKQLMKKFRDILSGA